MPAKPQRQHHYDDDVEAVERLAIQNTPPLPAPGTAARLALDEKHAAMVAGLLKCADFPKD